MIFFILVSRNNAGGYISVVHNVYDFFLSVADQQFKQTITNGTTTLDKTVVCNVLTVISLCLNHVRTIY